MIQNKIVVRYQDGRILKGQTGDFLPTKPVFHFTPADAGRDAKPIEVQVAEVKAIFFVKDFGGDPAYRERRRFEEHEKPHGRKLEVTLIDGEVMAGTTVGYDPHRQGFFVYPVDSQGNNLRVFVVSASVSHFRYLQSAAFLHNPRLNGKPHPRLTKVVVVTRGAFPATHQRIHA